MNSAYLVLLVLLIIYIPIYVWVWKNPEKAKGFHLVKYGPCLMISTRIGIGLMDRLSKYTRFWRFFGFISKLISAILLFLMLYMMVVAILAIPSRIGSESIGIEYALAIPGFNPILPLSYGIVALLIAMAVHEFGHGVQTRANDADVKSTGLLYGVVPLGAYVEPDDEQMRAKSRRVQMDMYTAGISVNTFLAIFCMILLVFSCGQISTDDPDAAGVSSVDMNSPAYLAEIPASALIMSAAVIMDDGTVSEFHELTTVEFDDIFSLDFVDPTLDFDPREKYILEYRMEDGIHRTSDEGIQIGAFIKTVTVGSAADKAGIEYGTFLQSMTIDGTVYKFDGCHEFKEVMETTYPGQEIKVTTISMDTGEGYELKDYYVTLTSKGGVGFLGLSVNTSGMSLITPEAYLDRATDPFYNVTEEPFSYVQSLLSYMSGPFNGMTPVHEDVRWWYDAPAGEIFWIIMSLLYWIFWLDLLLAISNALPAYPFDGGFIFAGGINWLLERLGVRDEAKRQTMSDNVSNAVSNVTMFAFVMVILSFLL